MSATDPHLEPSDARRAREAKSGVPPHPWQRVVDGFVRRASPHAPWLEIAFVLLVVVGVWGPFLSSSHVDNRWFDWTYRTNYAGYGSYALFHDHQLPFWVTDPRFEGYRVKGAHDFFANPETDVISIVTPLAELWGLLTAVKVSLVAYLALGVWGCRRLLVALAGAAGPISLLVAAVLVLCNGAIVSHVLVGHTQFLPMATFPLTLALMLEAFDPGLHAAKRSFRACLAGAMLAVDYYAGAVHPVFYFLVCFVALAPWLTVLLSPRRSRVVLPAAGLVGASFVAIGAFKLLPGFEDFGGFQADYHFGYDGWRDFAAFVVTPWSPEGTSHEANLYVGWVGVGLLAFALLGVRSRASWPLLLACAATASLMFLKGDNRIFTLPMLRSEGIHTRFRYVVLLVVGALAAAQIQRTLTWVRRLPNPALRIAPVALLLGSSLFLAFDLSRENVLRHETLGAKDAPPAMQGPYDVAPELVPLDTRIARVSVGPVDANRFGYEFSNTSPDPTLLLAPSLRMLPRTPHLELVGDGELTARDGALAVRIVGPQGRFELRFSDPLTSWGLAISLLGLVGLTALGLRCAEGLTAVRIPRLSVDGPHSAGRKTGL